MTSIRCFMKITTLVLFGFVFHVVCLENRKKCFEIEEKTICYFISNVSLVDWDTAWKTCRDLRATLPVIPSEKVQTELSNYLTDNLKPVNQVWTAGRYIGNDEWRWLNGEAFTGMDKPSCPYNSPSCRHETQAVLTKKLKYEASYPADAYDYICRFPGVSCINNSEYNKQKTHIFPWKDGCLKWRNNDRQPLNRARNKCLKEGGDLATFSEDGDLQRLQQFSHMLDDANKGYWVGLHRKWWIWNATDAQGIKYNLLNASGNFESNCMLIDARHKWRNDSCSIKKNVICQTVTDTYTTSSTMPDTDKTSSTITGVVIAVLALVIIIVVLLVFIKKRAHIAEAKAETRASTAKSNKVSASQNDIVQNPDNIYATIDLGDDLENLNYENGPNPKTMYTKLEVCDNSAVYSEPVDFGASLTDRSTDLYAEPYSNSVVTPVPKNLSPSSDVFAAPMKPGQQKKSDELTSPPIKIGPHGDIYTLTTSRI